MIRPQTILNVADNSGAKKLMCIRILGGSYKQSAKIGDIVYAKDNFKIEDISDLRVNVIGYVNKSQSNESGIIISKDEILKRNNPYAKY